MAPRRASAIGVGKWMVSVADRSAIGVAQRLRDPAEHRAGAGDRHLLADDRAHHQLEAVDVSGHAEARMLAHERREQRVLLEQRVDGDRVGVEVEQPPAPLHRGREVPQVVEPQRAAM